MAPLPRLADVSDDLARLWFRAEDDAEELPAGDAAADPVFRARDGRRMRVRGLRFNATHDARLTPLRDTDYDELVVVRFTRRFEPVDMWRLPREAVEELALWSDEDGGYVLHCDRALRRDPRLERRQPATWSGIPFGPEAEVAPSTSGRGRAPFRRRRPSPGPVGRT